MPDEDIPIAFTGIRPGEKLYEELIGPDEAVELADAADVMCVQPVRLPSPEVFLQQVAQLERRAKAEDVAGVLEQLRVTIPEFRATPESRADAGTEAVDLTSIDAAVQDQPKPTRPAFSPRSLR